MKIKNSFFNKLIAKGVLLLILLLSFTSSLMAESFTIEMADKLRADGRIYAVLAVMLIIFTGIIAFLVYIDRRISKLERKNKP
ncbi:MAG: CcmD family protein [Chitinophagaceae bacterium]|nr:MAG: CcmD family protein [Chitinophagaceae bacterium]